MNEKQKVKKQEHKISPKMDFSFLLKKSFLKKIFIYLFYVFLVFNILSIFTFKLSDSSIINSKVPEQISNALGLTGANYSGSLYSYFGNTLFLIPFLMMFCYPVFFLENKIYWFRKLLGFALVFITIGYMISLFYENDIFYGGIIGEYCSYIIKKYLGIVGQFIFLLSMIFLSISFLIHKSIKNTIQATKIINDNIDNHPIISKIKNLFEQIINKFNNSFNKPEDKKESNVQLLIESDRLAGNTAIKEEQISSSVITKPSVIGQINSQENMNLSYIPKVADDDDNNNSIAPINNKAEYIKPVVPSINEYQSLINQYDNIEDEIDQSLCNIKINLQKEEDNISISKTEEKPVKASKDYQIPMKKFNLSVSEEVYENNDRVFELTSRKLENTLKDFGIEAKVVAISHGPVITRYELTPAPGIKLSRIVNLQDNISLALAKSRIRIVAPIPGKSAIGIEIPNENRQSVTLGDLLNSFEYKECGFTLPLALGKDVSGKIVICDLSSMPHLLIAGSTGSGKSVCINSLICSVLYSKTPKDVNFIMIDPKIVELKGYNDIPHLLVPVINEPKQAIYVMNWLIKEMERRYQLLDEYDTKNIKNYNKKIEQLGGVKAGLERLSHIVLIVDEYADLMLTSGKEIEGLLSRLAAKARASGIHLIIATQRPSVDVITGLIKANFPARVAFQVTSKIESRIILDMNGADKLIGKGDLLFSAPGLPYPIRIQGAYLSEEEVSELCEYLKSQGEPQYIEDILIEDSTKLESYYDDDPLLDDAIETVLKDRKTSISYLQRKLKIGYNRSARLMEIMEAKGIVGASFNGKPREILNNN